MTILLLIALAGAAFLTTACGIHCSTILRHQVALPRLAHQALGLRRYHARKISRLTYLAGMAARPWLPINQVNTTLPCAGPPMGGFTTTVRQETMRSCRSHACATRRWRLYRV